MTARNTYTLRDERLMWEHLFERLQIGDETAYQPKGLKLWKDFEATQKTNKTASSLATHFRKAMYDHIEEAKIPVEQQLYIANQLSLPLTKRQRKTIEYKSNISITTDDFGVVTAYEKEGKQYLPYLLKRRILYEDNNINNELGYDAFELNGSMPKMAKVLRSVDENPISVACLGRYNLRKRLTVQKNKSPKIHNSEGTMDLMQDNSDRNDNRNEDYSVGGKQNEIFHAQQIFDEKKENEFEHMKVWDDAKGNTYEKQLRSIKINDEELGKNETMLHVEDEFHSDLKGSKMNISHSSDEIGVANFQSGKEQLVSEISANQVECLETTELESGIMQHAEGMKDLTVDNNRGIKMMSSEASKTVACSSTSILAAAVSKRKQEPLSFQDIIDEELKQLLLYILSKRQLKGVEKMKMEKILELRAKEAKRLGIGLRNYLRKMQCS
ncbi:Serine-rich coiled-coil domain-containing protein [Dirofilaria immitis]